MIKVMVQIHMTEAEAARDFHAVLARVREGVEVVIEEGHRRIALVRSPEAPGRPIEECIAIARARGSQATLDEDFAKDIEEIVATRKPLDTPAWE
jgi:hypothetical protein